MTFSLYLNGAEVGAHAKTLKAEGWHNVSVNYAHLRPKLPKRTPWTVADRLGGLSVLLDAGGAAIASKNWSQGELTDYAAELQEFTEDNADDLDLVLEFDSKALGIAWIREQRRGVYADLGDKFIPIWHRELGLPELDKLADTYHRVGISEDDLDEQTGLAARVNGIVARLGTEFHAVASAKPDDLRSVRFATAATGSWLSPTRYGETLLWDGQKLHRYPARMKDQARRRHASAVTRAGFDADLVAGDDNAEITRLTLWSLKQLEESVDRRRPDLTVVPFARPEVADNSAEGPSDPNAEIVQAVVDNSPAQVRKPTPRERVHLPVLGFDTVTTQETEDDGAQTLGERRVARLSSTSLRQCDTCFVAATCPAMQAGSECAFDLPVEIKTKDQLMAVLNAVIEMQTQRVMFGRFAEELAGGYPDANLSDEIERLFKLVTAVKKLEDNHSFVRMTVEANAGAGVLSRIFGEKAGTTLRELPQTIDADKIVDGALNGSIEP